VVIANPNSAALFYGFPNLTSISGFQYLDISNAKFIYVLDSGNSAFSIFGNCPKLNLDLSDLDASNVTNMSFMFQGYNGEGLTIGNWNTSNVTDMSHMFSDYSGGLLTIGDWNTSNVTTMSYMFSFYSGDQPLDLSSLDTIFAFICSLICSYIGTPLELLIIISITHLTRIYTLYTDYTQLSILKREIIKIISL